MKFQMVLMESRDGVARITLNRPEKLNAISPQLWDELEATLAEAEADSTIHVVVLRGAGKAFCSGFDISPGARSRSATVGDDRIRLRRNSQRWMAIWDFPKPLIAQVHGYCIAGGGELAGMCDLIFCADDAKFGHPAGRALGIPVTLGLWPFKIGMLHAKALLFTGDLIDGKEAERIGMVNRSMPATDLEQYVSDLAGRVARVPLDALRIHKHVVNRWFEVAGIRTAALEGAEFDAIYHQSDAAKEFAQIVRERGLRAALAWRDGPFQAP